METTQMVRNKVLEVRFYCFHVEIGLHCTSVGSKSAQIRCQPVGFPSGCRGLLSVASKFQPWTAAL